MATTAVIGFTTCTEHYKPLQQKSGFADEVQAGGFTSGTPKLWAKIIYTAKGTNKSWEWLSMITVCIFTLHDAM
jgi:hypothetical protein